MSGFNVILPVLIKELHLPMSSAVWPAGAFALVTASFLLPFGRLADMYGGYPVYLGGLLWFAIWSVIAGFSRNEFMLNFCRALQGLGPAAFLVSGVSLIGSTYRPGPRKNIIFSLYGGSAPLGFFFGIFIAGISGELLSYHWYFWIGAIIVFSIFVTAYFFVPSDVEEHKESGIKMDWMGSGLIVSGLVLVVFALTDSSHAPQGWRTPYVYVCLIVGSILLSLAVYVEGWVAPQPLLPFELFQVPYMKALMISLFFSYGVLGIWLLYATLYMQDIMGGTPLQITAWFTPMCIGGIIISTVGGYILHLLPGTMLMLISGLGWILTSLLFALAPEGGSFWAYILPAMIGATIGIDIAFNVANIFITTTLPGRHQGLAGALANSILYLGIAFLLAFADITQTQTAHLGKKRSYQSVFWYQLACATTALVIMMGFVRIRAAESDLTADERAEMEKTEKS